MRRFPTSLLLLLLFALPLKAQSEDSELTASAALETTRERGPVKLSVELRPEEPSIGDPLELTLIIDYEQGVEIIPPGLAESIGEFEFSSLPTRTTESLEDQRKRLTRKYELKAPPSGIHAIPPMLVEFLDRRPGKKLAPDGEPAYEILSDRLEFEVNSVLPASEPFALKPEYGELEPLPEPSPPVWPWFVGAGIALLVASPFLVRAWQRYQRLRRRRSAYDIAKQRLGKLLSGEFPSGDAVDRFYVDLSGILRRYLEDRFTLRAPESTTEEFLVEVSESKSLTDSHQRILRDFLRSADLVKFASHRPEESQIRESIAMVEGFVEETRENAPLLETDDDESPERRASA